MDLEVDRSDLRRTRIAAGRPLPDEPSTGSVLCRIDSFALTANNVTYAVVGDMIGYWKFFPSTDEGWGRVPVWGYGDVVASSHPEVAAGERYYGYWPMSSHVLLEPTAVGPHGLTDGTAHRASLPAVYNRYQRVAEEGDDDAEARQALLAPLFATSFLIDDWLGEHDLFGAGVVVLSSASSKTALGLAHLLKEHRRGEVTGLTSAAHVDFVASTGAYDHVLPYDDLPAGLGDGPAVYVDMAGDAGVLAAVHHHFGDRLRRSVRVGFTHHDAPAAGGDLPGPAPEMFFAPDHVAAALGRLGRRRVRRAPGRGTQWVRPRHGLGPRHRAPPWCRRGRRGVGRRRRGTHRSGRRRDLLVVAARSVSSWRHESVSSWRRRQLACSAWARWNSASTSSLNSTNRTSVTSVGVLRTVRTATSAAWPIGQP